MVLTKNREICFYSHEGLLFGSVVVRAGQTKFVIKL